MMLFRALFFALLDFVKTYGPGIGALGTLVAAIYAVRTYRRSQRLEESRFLVQLYEKFFESVSYKAIREALDCGSEAPGVADLVTQESREFTDYLNFFEMVAVLIRQKQVSFTNVESLFDYYLGCLKKHRSVYAYIKEPSNGFEELSTLLARIE